MNTSILRSGDYILTSSEHTAHYMFKPYSDCVKVLIDDGFGWRTYDSAMFAGNYNVPQARIFWDSLIKQGFTTHNENA